MEGTHEDSVVKLNGGGVLEHVPPDTVRLVGGSGVEVGEELVRRRYESSSHRREVVVDESGVKSSDECT
jgi:hypothetical protein